jgi:hypothetical protein
MPRDGAIMVRKLDVLVECTKSRQRNAGRSGVPDDRPEEKRGHEQKQRRERWLRKRRRKYPRKGLADLALDETRKP